MGVSVALVQQVQQEEAMKAARERAAAEEEARAALRAEAADSAAAKDGAPTAPWLPLVSCSSPHRAFLPPSLSIPSPSEGAAAVSAHWSRTPGQSAPPANSLAQLMAEEAAEAARKEDEERAAAKRLLAEAVKGKSGAGAALRSSCWKGGAVSAASSTARPAAGLDAPDKGVAKKPAADPAGNDGLFWDYSKAGAGLRNPPTADSWAKAARAAGAKHQAAAVAGASAVRSNATSAGNGARSEPTVASGPPSQRIGAHPVASAAAEAKVEPESVAAPPGTVADLPPEMRTWCEANLSPLLGSSEMTLAEFLWTVEDPSELRSYAELYLGKSGAVAKFAGEFCEQRRKLQEAAKFQVVPLRGAKASVASGSSASAPSAQAKGADAQGGQRRKKKTRQQAIDKSLLGYTVESSRIMKGELDLGNGS